MWQCEASLSQVPWIQRGPRQNNGRKEHFFPYFVRTLRSGMVLAVVRDHELPALWSAHWPWCPACRPLCYPENAGVGKIPFPYRACSQCSLEQSCILETFLGQPDWRAGTGSWGQDLYSWASSTNGGNVVWLMALRWMRNWPQSLLSLFSHAEWAASH